MALATFPRTPAGKAAAAALARYFKTYQYPHEVTEHRFNGHMRITVKTKDPDIFMDIPAVVFEGAGVDVQKLGITTSLLSIGGVEVQPEQDKAINPNDLAALNKRGEMMVAIHGQFSIDEAQAIKKFAEEQHLSVVKVIRLAVRRYFGL